MTKAIALTGLAVAVLSFSAAVYAQDQMQGKNLYTSYCAGCHGEDGKGDGPAAMALPVRPANHTDGMVMNQLPDKFLMEIISKGGAAVGKSPIMPAWGGQFNEKQLRDIVAYVRSLAQPAYHPNDHK